jgi:hypothetical protein
MPRRANIKMKRKRRSRRERMEDMAFIRATTKLRKLDQYLHTTKIKISYHSILIMSSCTMHYFSY